MAYDPKVVQAIVQQARLAGVNPALMAAVAMEESGLNPRAVGDQRLGGSYGLFQLHTGGALGRLSPQQAFDPSVNAGVIARSIAAAGGQKWGPDAAGLTNYYRAIGRGSSVSGPTNRALSMLPQVQSLLGQPGAQVPAVGTQAQQQVTAAGTPSYSRGLSSGLLASLADYGRQVGTAAQQGQRYALPKQLAARLAQTQQQNSVPTAEVAKGAAPPTVPQVTGRSGVATNAALQELGVPYSWGGGTPAGPSTGFAQGAGIKGFDCSALVQYAWAKAGVQLPRTSQQQMTTGTAVPNLASATAGDLLFPHPGHVMMYLGNGKAVESPHTGASVQVVDVTGRSFQSIRRPG